MNLFRRIFVILRVTNFSYKEKYTQVLDEKALS